MKPAPNGKGAVVDLPGKVVDGASVFDAVLTDFVGNDCKPVSDMTFIKQDDERRVKRFTTLAPDGQMYEVTITVKKK